MDNDSILLVNEQLNLLLQNDTLIVKSIIKETRTTSNQLFEIVKLAFPIVSTLSGVFVGYLINKKRDDSKESKINTVEFKNELLKCNNGTGNYNSLLIAYSKLSKQDKQKYISALDYDLKTPEEKHLLIKSLLAL
jgi:hypothetical protein